MKTCTKCKEKKPTSEFNKHPTTTDGKMAMCKPCHNEYNRIRRAKKVNTIRFF